MKERDIQTLIEQIVPKAHPQQVTELVAAVMSAGLGKQWTSTNGDWSDAGCVLQSAAAGIKDE